MRSRLFAIYLSIFGIISVNAYADENQQAQQLLNYFSATCPSQGEWTRAALGQTEAVIATLQSLQNDPDCKSLAGAVGQLNVLSRRIQSLQNRTTEREFLGLKKEQEELLLQLTNETDPGVQDMIKGQLRSVQVSIASNQGYQDAEKKEQRIQDSEAVQNLVMGTNLLLSQAISNQACLVKSPQLLSGLASIAGSVWAALATSGLSLVIAGGVELFGNIIEWARQNEIARKVDKVAATVAETAYRCVLESLSNQWCGADDALRIIDIKRKSHDPKNPLWVGVRLLDREVPNFLNWLETVRAGAEPASLGESERQNRVFQREAQLRSARSFGLGILNENKILFDTAGTDQLKWSVERATINDILTKVGVRVDPYGMGGASGGSPLNDVYDGGYAPYFLLGLERTEVPPSGFGGGMKMFSEFDPFTDWPQGKTFSPELEGIRGRLQVWIQTAQERVNAERNSSIQPDPLQLFVDAVTAAATGSQRNLSPVRSIQNLKDFLVTQEPSTFLVPAHRKLYRETEDRLQKILDQINLATADKASIDYQAALGEIYNVAMLDHGQTLFEGRLTRSIRMSLNEIVVNGGSGVDSDTAAQLLVADDIIKELYRYSPRGNLALIKSDVENSQRMTENTIQRFVEIFSRDLGRILRHYRSRAAEETRPGKYTEGKAQLCLSLLAVPKVAATDGGSDVISLCQGSQLESLFENGRPSMSVTSVAFDLPLEHRACALRNFYRGEKIFQDRVDDAAGLRAGQIERER